MSTGSKAVALARECLKTPFKHQGRVCGLALDCAGVLVHVFKGLGVDYYDPPGYPRQPYEGLLEKIIGDQPHLTKIPTTDIKAGDVVLFRIKTSPSHIGICTGAGLVHAYYDTGRVVEQRLSSWQRHIAHAYRIVL